MNFRLGINYWPRNSAMAWWHRFDQREVERDFARIRAASLDSVRIFLLWEDFQPAPDQLSERSLARLVTVADIAAANRLSLALTLFTGHMSGINWIPEWALDQGVSDARFPVVSGGVMSRRPLKNWYTDETIIRAQALLAREVAAALRHHPALWFWDLGNENSNCVIPPTREAGRSWLKRITDALRSVDFNHPITVGLHQEDLERDNRLGPAEAARACDFLCMHGYPMYLNWANGPADEQVLPFLGLITRWLGQKDVLFAEFGAPAVAPGRTDALARAQASGIPILSEDEGAQFTRRALAALQRFGFMGAMLWCYGDYAPALWDEPPFNVAAHEPFFGLWRTDGSPKPAIAEVTHIAGTARREPEQDYDWIDIERDHYYHDPKEHLRRLYRRFRDYQKRSETRD
jgi:endo-1,4-beta-mannosidase